jgi:hypothetical protein
MTDFKTPSSTGTTNIPDLGAHFSAPIQLKYREVDQIISTINNLESQMLTRLRDGTIELVVPTRLAEIIGKIAVLLQQTVDPITFLDREFRQTRARRFDKFLKQGIKKTPAMDSLKFEPDLIDMEIAVNRVNAFIKRTEQTITTIQSNMRVKNGAANGNF